MQWVTRVKTGFQYRAVQNLPVPVGRRIIKGQIVTLKGAKGQKSAKCKGWTLRRVEAIVEVDAQDKVTVFITNNVGWSARSVGDLYRARWEFEVFLSRRRS